MRFLRRLFRDERGQSLLELAISLPLIIAFMLGAISLTMAANGRNVVTNAARNAGRFAAIECGAGKSNWLNDTINLVRTDLEKGALKVGTFAPVNSNATPGQWYVTASCTGPGGFVTVEVQYAQVNLFPPLQLLLTGQGGSSNHFPMKVSVVFPVE